MSVNKRRVIYVDITGEENNTQFKLGLYDPEVNRVEILQLKEMSHNTEAEKYAIFYAMLYIKKHDLSNTIVLCDNKSAVNDKMVQSLAQFLKINISWIPREINTVADKVCKLETNLKDIDWNLLT
jgi:ribonuclease HI